MWIATPTGEEKVSVLRVGSRVITRNDGIQIIVWIGQRYLSCETLEQNQHLVPIVISAGALGRDMPTQDMVVSPHTRVLIKADDLALYPEDNELLVPARNLIGVAGVRLRGELPVTYVHFTFEQHAVVRVDGVWIERVQPKDSSVLGLGEAQRDEMQELYPELSTTPDARSLWYDRDPELSWM